MYRIDKINALLKEEKAPILSISMNKDIFISRQTQTAMNRLLVKINESSMYYFSKRERIIYMYLMLFFNEEYLSLQHFIEALQVSRSTVLLDYKELLQILDEQNIQVKNNRTNGYYLVGEEVEVRCMMMKFVIYALADDQNAKVFDAFIEDYHLDTFAYSKLVIMEMARNHNIRFVEGRLIEFIYIFIFLKVRIKSRQGIIDVIPQWMDNDVMHSLKEHGFTVDLLKNYKGMSCVKQADINYIASWILGISYGDINEDTRDCIIISDLVGKIMSRFESLSGAHYQKTEEIFIQLYSHFRPAYYRLLFKIPIFNPLCDKVISEYKELYQLVSETMKPFHALFGQNIPKDEIAYLTMHFATIYLDKKAADISRQKIALVVCSNGIGSSVILFNELTSMFPELHFLPPMEANHLADLNEDVDIIFTTCYISHMIDTNIPVVRVFPVMTMRERYQVVRDVYMQLGSVSMKQPNVEIVMKIIQKYANITKENALYNELLIYFSQVDTVQEEQESFHIYDMVKQDSICLQVEVLDWEQAIRMAYEPMVNKRYITQNYVEETIRCMKLVGPFVVIAKHVALPHTKPSAGALECALGICVLKEPIVFGNKDNDPIKYIFSLSAIDNKQHLLAMAELMELLNDENFYALLNSSDHPQEIMDYLKKVKI